MMLKMIPICTLSLSLLAQEPPRPVGLNLDWVFIDASKPDNDTVYLNSKSITFDDKYQSLTCWVRFYDHGHLFYTLSKFAFRSHGDEWAEVSSTTFNVFDDSLRAVARTFQPNQLSWTATAPGTIAEELRDKLRTLTTNK